MLDFASAPTPFILHPWTQVEYEIPRPKGAARTQPTMISNTSDKFDVFNADKGTDNRTLFSTSPNRDAGKNRVRSKAPVDSSGDTDGIASQRVQLLAAQYANGPHAKELQARLEILNHRLLERSPRVSVEQVEFLENVNTQLETLAVKRTERAQRLGLQMDRTKEVQAALRAHARG